MVGVINLNIFLCQGAWGLGGGVGHCIGDCTPILTGVKVRSSSSGEILKLVKLVSYVRIRGQLRNGQSYLQASA